MTNHVIQQPSLRLSLTNNIYEALKKATAQIPEFFYRILELFTPSLQAISHSVKSLIPQTHADSLSFFLTPSP